MSRLQPAMRLMRLMHTAGRQVPHPGQAGAPEVGTTSPSPHSHLPLEHGPVDPFATASSALDRIPLDIDAESPAASTSTIGAPTKFTPKGRPIPTRPPRSIRVNLPSGYPEPDSYPVSADYVSGLSNVERAKPHPLWQFFHVPEKATEALREGMNPVAGGMGSLDVQGEGDGEARLNHGRSWSAAELRQMSFQDLHTLWYVLLKERNVLATQREERRRLSVHAREGGELMTKRAFRCRKSMARIKYVLNERRLGLLAAFSPLSSPALSDKNTSGHVPFSATGVTDPAIPLAALRGQAALPAWVYDNMELSPEEESMLEEEDGEEEAVVPDAEVAKQEVESRDEGFGGGKEAAEFVDQVQVEDGHVQKK